MAAGAVCVLADFLCLHFFGFFDLETSSAPAVDMEPPAEAVFSEVPSCSNVFATFDDMGCMSSSGHGDSGFYVLAKTKFFDLGTFNGQLRQPLCLGSPRNSSPVVVATGRKLAAVQRLLRGRAGCRWCCGRRHVPPVQRLGPGWEGFRLFLCVAYIVESSIN